MTSMKQEEKKGDDSNNNNNSGSSNKEPTRLALAITTLILRSWRLPYLCYPLAIKWVVMHPSSVSLNELSANQYQPKNNASMNTWRLLIQNFCHSCLNILGYSMWPIVSNRLCLYLKWPLTRTNTFYATGEPVMGGKNAGVRLCLVPPLIGLSKNKSYMKYSLQRHYENDYGLLIIGDIRTFNHVPLPPLPRLLLHMDLCYLPHRHHHQHHYHLLEHRLHLHYLDTWRMKGLTLPGYHQQQTTLP